MKTFLNNIIIILIINSSISFAQITAPDAHYSIVTQYKSELPLGSGNWILKPANEQDSVYIFCSDEYNIGTLSAPGTSGCTFDWRKYEPLALQFISFSTTQTAANLSSGLYEVIVTCGSIKSCYKAQVLVNQTITELYAIVPGCSPFQLSGVFDKVSDFVVYAPPDESFIIDSTTQIEVCFTVSHTFVSDLGFYLIAPDNGSGCSNTAQPGEYGIVELLPSVTNWNTVSSIPISSVSCSTSEINTNCNSGNNVENFCFTTALPAGNPAYTACVCDLPTPLTDTFASAGPWSTIYGQQVPAPYGTTSNCGWSVLIMDCEPVDVGYLTQATIKFTGNGVCGQATHYYDSGYISSYIEDGACSVNTASRFVIPPAILYQYIVPNTIVSAVLSCSPVTWNPAWGSTDFLSDSSPRDINPPPTENTWFYLTLTDNFGCVKVDTSYFLTSPTIINPVPDLCTNDTLQTLQANISGGIWSCTDCNPNPIIDSINGIFDPSVGAGTYDVVYVLGIICDNNSISIKVNPVISISNYDDECFGQVNKYVISFDLNGTPPYYVNWQDGSINGNHFISTLIQNNSYHSFEIYDNSNCGSLTFTSNMYCDCFEYVELGTSDVIVCENDPVTVIPINNFMFNDDTLVYYLHKYPRQLINALYQINNPIDSNYTGIFNFDSLSMQLDTQYYVSAVVGKKIINSWVDAYDGCKYVSNGTPIKWSICDNINENSITSDYKLSIKPNPFKDEFEIEYLLKNNSKIKIEFFDICGKNIYTSESQQTKGFKKQTINKSLFIKSGIYYLRFNDGNVSITKKIVKL